MTVPLHLASFWSDFLQSTGRAADAPCYEAFHFADTEAVANELVQLVLQGAKRATAAAAWTFEAQGKPLPEPGDLSIATDWAGTPLCVIETRAVEVVPFREVEPTFAALEGEGDCSLGFWRRAHEAYFTRECARAGRVFSHEMLVVCERFEVVYAVRAGAAARKA